jgi:hypothetical protein
MADRPLDELAKNARVLAELVVDPTTTPATQLKILNKLMEGTSNKDFFVTMFEEAMTRGTCPKCKHENHWFIPDEQLSQMGWVTHKEDERVHRSVTSEDCKEFGEACRKKKCHP